MMAPSKPIEKLKKYYARLEAGKTKKIKPSDVEKVMRKLEANEQKLLEEIAAATKASKKTRLAQKLETTRNQLDRAKWLQAEIN